MWLFPFPNQFNWHHRERERERERQRERDRQTDRERDGGQEAPCVSRPSISKHSAQMAEWLTDARHPERVYLSLEASSGMPRHISRSNLPARRRAGSNESGRFVAPMTRTRAVAATLLRSGKTRTQGERRKRLWTLRTVLLALSFR